MELTRPHEADDEGGNSYWIRPEILLTTHFYCKNSSGELSSQPKTHLKPPIFTQRARMNIIHEKGGRNIRR